MAGKSPFTKRYGKKDRLLLVLVVACCGVLNLNLLWRQISFQKDNRPTSPSNPTQTLEQSAVAIPFTKTLPHSLSLNSNHVFDRLIPLLEVKERRFTFSVPEALQGRIVYEGKLAESEKVIALTIDDGPWPQTTDQILDILKQHQVKATFFWVGEAVQKSPDIAKRVVAEGHAIGNHTLTHSYSFHDAATIANEVDRTAEIIDRITGVKTSLFRPPGGFLNNGLAKYARQKNYAVVMWSLTSADTDPRAKPEAFVRNVLRGAKPGAIVLMHDGGGDRTRTVTALPDIIAGLKQQGYRFVTVPELLEMQQQPRQERS